MKYTHLCFDADNTLFSFDAVEIYAMTATFADFSIPWKDEYMDVYAPYNHSLWLAFEQGKIEKPYLLSHRFSWLGEQIGYPIDGDAFFKQYDIHLGEKYVLMPHSEEVCRCLAPHYVMAVTTNGNTVMQTNRLNRSPLKPFFPYLFISDELGCAKPSEEYFQQVLTAMQVTDRSKVLMIGDTVAADMIGANRAGIDCCWFNPKGETQQDAKINYEIRDLRELLAILLPDHLE